MAGVNNVITSMFPLFMKDKLNSGMTAGVLNGFCYIGSMLSSYGLGLVSDAWGWNAVLWTLFGACALVSLCGGWVYALLRVLQKNKTK
jgi:sugar phosphate permease